MTTEETGIEVFLNERADGRFRNGDFANVTIGTEERYGGWLSASRNPDGLWKFVLSDVMGPMLVFDQDDVKAVEAFPTGLGFVLNW